VLDWRLLEANLLREAAQPSRSLRFGSFEVDLRAGELRKNGMKLRLTGQPFEVLAFLLERPGEVVTREEFQKRLWADTFVDFEHNLNTAINKIREVLGDSAESPRFVETLPRRGYRFIASVQGHPSTPARTSVVKWVGLAGVSSVALLAVVVSLHVGRSKENVLEGDRKPIRSLAVLPFANLSSDPEQDYFAEGTTEALITELGKIDGLRVISRQSTMQYRGTTKSASQIAHELNVEAIVEGSVIRAGDRVRISVQLIGAAPERHLWSNSYDRDLRDILLCTARWQALSLAKSGQT
jgi:TolB-like protein/DNA-binding winged helix-turn-helix (wHTH) protein